MRTDLSRRRLLGAAGGAGLLAACGEPRTAAAPVAATPGPLPPLAAEAWLAELERRSFDFFWERANPANGLVPDRWPTPSFASVAAVGFALMGYAVAANRGWVTRAQAAQRAEGARALLFLDVPTAARALLVRWMPPSLVTYIVWFEVPLKLGWNQMPCWSACA